MIVLGLFNLDQGAELKTSSTPFLTCRELRHRPAFAALLLACVLCSCGTGCDRGSEQNPPPTSRDQVERVPGGTAVIALAGDPDVLNSLIRASSYAGMVLAELKDELIELGEDLEWEPRIASSWDLLPGRVDPVHSATTSAS